MMKAMVCAAALVFSASLLAADSGPKEEVIHAAKALQQKENYSWKTTVVVPESARFKPGPTEGKTEKEGATYLMITFGDNTIEAVLKGDKGAMAGADGEWKSLADVENDQNRGRFMAGFLRNMKTPAEEAVELAGEAKDLKKDGEVYSGDLTEEGAKNLLRFRRRGGNGGPEVSGAKGSVKFWVKDGVLSKVEYSVKGSISFNGNDVDVDRSTTMQIKDVGTTKVIIPKDAREKLS
jgi:hypothetical protein